nr:hypothetical protein [Tanacetum cinerariifolium]
MFPTPVNLLCVRFNVRNTKAKSIRNPRIKLAHQCITMTITGRKETTNRVIEIDLFYLYCIFVEGVVCNILYWLAKYLKSVRDKSMIFKGMFLTKIARSFGLLTNGMVSMLNREPLLHVYRNTLLVQMGVIMELYEGECCWPATREVVKEGEGDDEEGDEEGGTKEKETTNRVIEIDLFYLYCIFVEGVVCNILYWLAKEVVKEGEGDDEEGDEEGGTKDDRNDKVITGTPTEPHHTPSPEAQQTSHTPHSSLTLLPVTTALILTVTTSDTPLLRQYTRRTRIAQSLVLPHVVDKHASPLEEADKKGSEQSRDDAPIKGKMLDVWEEAAERVSDDIEEMATVLTSTDAATVLLSGVAEVPIGSGSIPTVGPPAAGVPTGSNVVLTAGPIFATTTVVTPYTRRKGKEKMIESETPKKKKIQEQMNIQMARQLEEEMEREAQRMNEQIARDAKIARRHTEEELQIMIDGLDRSNETVSRQLCQGSQISESAKKTSYKEGAEREFYTSVLRNQVGWNAKDFKGMTLEEIKENFDPVWKQIHEFIPIGSKEEAKRFKRKGIRFEQECVKKLKTSEEVKASEEVLEEKVKEMMQLVPIKELWRIVKESLSIRSATSDKEMELWVELKDFEWKLYDTCRVHHVTSKDKDIFMLVEKDYPLRKGLAIVMISYKLQVENYSQMANDLILKIYKIANCPRRIVGNKMHKAFLLPAIEFPLPEEKRCHCREDCTAAEVKQ